MFHQPPSQKTPLAELIAAVVLTDLVGLGADIERLQLLADCLEGFLPLHRDVAVGLGLPAHRPGQAAHFLKLVIAPAFEFLQHVGGEKRNVGAAGRDLPGGRLGAVLAKLE